ncbi:hypothetical protein KR018_003556, partial [Drosophila ironensis]
YPEARRDMMIEERIHDYRIRDAYRWMEDPDSDETQSFVKEQNNFSKPFLEKSKEWEKIHKKLEKFWNYPKYSCPSRHGDFYYFYKNTGLKNQSMLMQQKSLDGPEVVFLDPNSMASDGTTTISQKSFSDNGAFMAYGISEKGADWIKVRIRRTVERTDYPETLRKVKFSTLAWTADNKGFFYSHYPDQQGKANGMETNGLEFQKLYYHRLGESQVNDIVAVEYPEQPGWRTLAYMSDCGTYLILCICAAIHGQMLYYANLEPGRDIKEKLRVKPIYEKFDADFDFITSEGSKMYFRTNKDASNSRVIVIDVEKPAEENWTTLIPEHETDVINWVKCVSHNQLLICYNRDVAHILQSFDLYSGKMTGQFGLEIGTITGCSGKKQYSEIFYSFTSFLIPQIVYQYDFAKIPDNPKILRDIKLNFEGFHRDNYQVHQVFYRSKDNTQIPMYIVQKKRDKQVPRPCLLHAYGGFNWCVMPSFGLITTMFIDIFDGIVAIPNIRGGGEYGEAWHHSGRQFNKQNVFDDFQAAASYLIQNNYTTQKQLAIHGSSNGGLLVAVSLNQRPELFGAAVAQVGVLDMLRFHKFTIGHAWVSEFGNPEEKEHFANLHKFSPLHNIHIPLNSGEEYPSILIMAGDHDDRVCPLHSLKYAATLQTAAHNSKFQHNPILLRVYKKVGHGQGKSTTMRLREAADIITFYMKTLTVDTINL